MNAIICIVNIIKVNLQLPYANSTITAHWLYWEKEKRNTPTHSKIESEYDQEIPQSQTAANPVAPRGRAAQPSRDTRKTN